jgi:hypothetical protein
MKTLKQRISACRERWRAAAGVLLAAASLAACITPGPQTRPTAETVNTHSANGLRVIRVDETEMDIEKPQISGDTLFGIVHSGSVGDSAVAIPLADVRSVAVKRIDGTRTVIVVAAIVASIGVTAAGIIFSYRVVSVFSV